MKRKFISLASVIIFASLGCIAIASSPDAWEEFREDVREKCEGELKNRLIDPDIIVDPFGTSSSGLALGVGRSTSADEEHIIICVYDKTNKTVELGSAIRLENIPTYQRLLHENRRLRE